jgi:hypothetical protein
MTFEPDPTPVPQAEIDSALARIEREPSVESKVVDLMAALKESLSPGAPEKAAEIVEAAMPTPDIALAGGALMTLTAIMAAVVTPDDVPPPGVFVEQLESPRDTKGWTVARKDGIETFTATDGNAYVRAAAGEEADVIVNFTRIPGMTPMRLVRADESSTVRRAERKRRREERELRKRGYDVPS